MKYSIPAALVVLALAGSAYAGTISGKVSGAKGESVVYVEASRERRFRRRRACGGQPEGPDVCSAHRCHSAGYYGGLSECDSVAHNVFWPSIGGDKKLGHNMGTWPQGEKRSFTFDKPGAVPLLCNVHPDMSGYIIVSPTPFFATTDKSGQYRIENVPDGSYTVTFWNEGTKPHSSQVTVSGDTKADITLAK